MKFGVGVNIYLWAGCILPKIVMNVTMASSRTSSIMAEKNSKWLIYCDFSHFTSIICPCGRNNMKSFSFTLFQFVMHVTDKPFSDNFNNGRKKFKMADLLLFFCILCQ